MRPMPERGALAEGTAREQELKRISAALHDLCQPLTTLQCRLEMAEFIGTLEAHRQAVEAGLVECARMSVAVGAMRQTLRAVQQAVEEEIGAAG